ncbi:MAG: VWA domain-containing protein [Flavobacteriaceae bacterium]|nr:VWA domain-containing protein [Flavobacteriaceae bacterium]
METHTLIYIILAGIAALLLALFQYLYKAKKNSLNKVFAFLRFVTLFSVLLLLINPKFEQTKFYNEKPNLIVAIDNSESIKHLKKTENVEQLIDNLKQDKSLNENFNVEYYKFGKDFKQLDSLNFDETQSDIANIFGNLSQIYKNTVAPIVLITDGNQTYGKDYEFESLKYKQPIFPIILGDTITYSDLKIQQLNVNKYSYLKNKFPVEIIAIYNGSQNVSTQLIITSGNSTVFKKNLSFSKSQNSHVVNLSLPANRVGVNTYSAVIVPLESEQNKVNNVKPFAVEIIDEKTNIAIVSDIIHPDLGALKKAIESNEQRSVSILKPNGFLDRQDDFQLSILYQPNTKFKAVFNAIEKAEGNKFVITGTKTQWSFLNGIQTNYSQEITLLTEDFQPTLNSNYSTFIIDDLDFNSFPPLQSEFGNLTFKTPIETLLYKRVFNDSIEQQPLLVTFENNSRREAILLGENIWKWRAQSFLNKKSFQEFDSFIGKLVQYLASNKKRSRLSLAYESFYNGVGEIKISAQFFNKNYVFDAKANLKITLKNIDSGSITILPFILKNNSYEVNLSDFSPSDYDFIVSANNGEMKQSGHLKILDYNVEQQFLNANVTKLQQVATNSKGTSYFIDNYKSLITDMINDVRFKTIQKSSKNIVPLIDFKYLLALIALSLALEWFLRKYNGLI